MAQDMQLRPQAQAANILDDSFWVPSIFFGFSSFHNSKTLISCSRQTNLGSDDSRDDGEQKRIISVKSKWLDDDVVAACYFRYVKPRRCHAAARQHYC